MTQEDRRELAFKPFSFVHITDLHLAEDEGEQRLAAFADMLAAWPEVEFVLVTGDLIWQRPMVQLRRIFDAFNVPVHVIYGNNDWYRLEACEQTFGPRDKVFVHRGCLFLMWWNALAKTEHRNHQGDWTDAQHAWLEAQLTWARDVGCRHVFLCSHVPPMCPHGYFPIFFLRPEAEQRLWALCEKYQVTACFFGHLHQEDSFRHGRTQVFITPSLNWNFVETAPGRKERVAGGGAARVVAVHDAGVTPQLHAVVLDGDTIRAGA